MKKRLSKVVLRYGPKKEVVCDVFVVGCCCRRRRETSKSLQRKLKQRKKRS